VWPAAWSLLLKNFWLGVGPAQFGLFYPRYMAETAGPKVIEPGGAFLDVWAGAGAFGVVALAAVAALFGRAVWRWATASGGRNPPEEHATRGVNTPRSPEEEPTTNWEFYLGGMIGLVTAFVLRASTLPPEDITAAAVVAGVRAVVWFAAFSLYEGVGWTVEEHVGALVTGAGALFLCLLVQPGIDFPSVAVFLWVALALVLATVSPQPAQWLSRQAAVGMVTVPVFIAAAFGYFAFFFYPEAASASALRRAQYAVMNYRVEMNKAPEERDRALRDPGAYVYTLIIEPVEKARQEDRENVRLMTHLAHWYSELWVYNPTEQRLWLMAIAYPKLAMKANPEGPEGYLSEVALRRRFAGVLSAQANALEAEGKADKEKADKEKRDKEKRDKKGEKKRPGLSDEERKKRVAQFRQDVRKQHGYAVDLLREYLPRDPTDPDLHHQLADALFGAGRAVEGREEAEEALRLDEKASPPRKLPNEKREPLEKRLRTKSKG
jgi:hypothetical protein